MEASTNRLVLKANRSFGSRLTHAGLVELDDLDRANEIFVTRLRSGSLRDASLLRILLFELQVLSENTLLDWQLEKHAGTVGAVRLDEYQLQDDLLASLDLAACMATWTLPIDSWCGMNMLATAYGLSDFVRQYWEERIQGPITWMLCPFGQLDAFFEQREEAALAVES